MKSYLAPRKTFSSLPVILTCLALGAGLGIESFGQDPPRDGSATAAESASSTNNAEVADEQEPHQRVRLADGKLELSMPAKWEQVEPQSRIVELEFALPPAEGEKVAGRLTMMRSGGGVEANIERWRGQFVPDRSAESRDPTDVEKIEVDDLVVHVVDLAGTYLDRPRPFGPATERPDYRMLGAIVETRGAGDYYVKFYGPAATVDEHDEAFREMVQSLKWSAR